MRITGSAGFTLVELIIVTAVIGLIVSLGAPAYVAAQKQNQLAVATMTSVSALRHAQFRSQAAESDATWGTRFQAGSVTVFKGTSYAGRDASVDEVSPLPSSVAVSGSTEIVFSKNTGFPSSAASLILSRSGSGTKTITLNVKGNLSY